MVTATSFAQSRKKRKAAKEEKPASTGQSTSLEPFYPQDDYQPTAKKKKLTKATYTATDKFYERMDAIAKQERKAEKEMEKPQYSDPLYFGHKHPPKKHPPNKMKYCKICGIRH
jgi:hypothetical protein